LEKSFENLIQSAAKDIKKRVNNGNTDSSDSYDKDEKEDDNDDYDSKKRKKIPPKAVSILKEWLLENVQDPYPSNETKAKLAKKAGLHVK